MTEPSPSRPVPGPPRPGPGPGPAQPIAPTTAAAAETGVREDGAREDPFAGLVEQPVAEHVAVFEAEHSRLQRELGTIDRL
jgi:hypothetical protein